MSMPVVRTVPQNPTPPPPTPKVGQTEATRPGPLQLPGFNSRRTAFDALAVQICIGGVCVPLNLLVPFLIGIAHR